MLPRSPLHPRTTRTLPEVQPILPTPRHEPLDGSDWLFKPKYDGYCGLLYVTRKGSWVRSKRGNIFKRFQEAVLLGPGEAAGYRGNPGR